MKFCDEKIYCYNINININDKNTYDLLHTNIKEMKRYNKLYYFLKDHDLIKDIKENK